MWWLGGFRQSLGLRSGLHHGRAAASQCLGGGAQLQRKPQLDADQLELVTKIRGFFTIKWGIFTITRSLSLDMVID